jgi:hypothetical protein
LTGVDLVIGRSGTIRGTVFDQYGEPTEDAVVQIIPADRPAPPLPGAGLPPAGAFIDDRGQFTAWGLAPGKYYVGARIGTADTLIFFPGRTTLAEATPIELVAGAEETVDLFANTIRGLRLRGTIVSSTGKAPGGGRAQLIDVRERVSGTERAASISADGTFEFTNVPRGEYELSVLASPAPFVIVTSRSGQPVDAPPIPAAEYAHVVVTVDGADNAVVVRTAPGSSVKGTVTLEGVRRDEVSPLSLKLAAVPRLPLPVAVKSDWTFEIDGLSAPTRFVLAAPGGLWLKSFLVGDVNAAEETVPFGNRQNERPDVTVVLARTERLSGRVVDERGAAVANARVVAFSPDRSRWYEQSPYIRSVQVGPAGVFQIDVPPGPYRLVAVDVLDSTDEAMLTALEPASNQGAAGSSGDLTLRLIRLGR